MFLPLPFSFFGKHFVETVETMNTKDIFSWTVLKARLPAVKVNA